MIYCIQRNSFDAICGSYSFTILLKILYSTVLYYFLSSLEANANLWVIETHIKLHAKNIWIPMKIRSISKFDNFYDPAIKDKHNEQY